VPAGLLSISFALNFVGNRTSQDSNRKFEEQHSSRTLEEASFLAIVGWDPYLIAFHSDYSNYLLYEASRCCLQDLHTLHTHCELESNGRQAPPEI
jgi:hypothetical protein